MNQPSIWLVAIGSLSSIVASTITTILTHWFTHWRETKTRDHAKLMKNHDFRLKTLIELQDALDQLCTCMTEFLSILHLNNPFNLDSNELTISVVKGKLSVSRILLRINDSIIDSLADDVFAAYFKYNNMDSSQDSHDFVKEIVSKFDLVSVRIKELYHSSPP